MIEMNTRLNILKDVLEEKKSALEQIYNICENQQMVSHEPNTAAKAQMLKGMGSEKQKLVEIVLQCDSVFQKAFEDIKEEFESNAQIYKEQIKYLQTLIKQIVDLDIKIRNRESENKELISKEIYPPKPQNNSSKNYILKQYEMNNKKKK